MSVKKAVIPAAGLGTRFLPVTKSIPKEMLPILDKPVIHYIVEEVIQSEIEDILIITARGKRAIEDYFDASPELELYLNKNNKDRGRLVRVIKEIPSLADIYYVRQREPKGLGDAILKAEKHIGDEPFAVLLGDDMIISDVPAIKQLIRVFEKVSNPVIGIEKVPHDEVSKYGVIDGSKIGTVYKVRDLVEKPKPEEAPSDLAIIGRYILTPDIFDCIRETEPGVGGEIQLTDALRLLLRKREIYAYEIKGRRYDIGDKADYVRAIIDLAMGREELKERLSEYIIKIFRNFSLLT